MGTFRIYNGLTKTEPFAGYGGRIATRPVDHGKATAWASRILPTAFVSAVDFSTGAWDAPVPEGTPDDAANNFDSGFLPEPPASDWEAFDPDHFGPEMSERIATSLGCTPADLVVVPKASLVLIPAQWAVDHLASSPSALALVREMSPQPNEGTVAWTSAMGVFYPVHGSGLDRDAFADLMDLAAHSDSEFMMLTSAASPEASVSQALPDADLGDLVARADAVVLGAFDGEGYLRWSRSRPV